jgi:uncharacterized sporulation protein YeaH/YhbH (DUF444 family)
MPTPSRTTSQSHHPRASGRQSALDWARFTPTPINRDLAARRQWERAIQEEARDLARLQCDSCGHVGLGLIARFRRDTGTYAPLAYCPGCGEAVEF